MLQLLSMGRASENMSQPKGALFFQRSSILQTLVLAFIGGYAKAQVDASSNSQQFTVEPYKYMAGHNYLGSPISFMETQLNSKGKKSRPFS